MSDSFDTGSDQVYPAGNQLPPVNGRTPNEAGRNLSRDRLGLQTFQQNPLLAFFYVFMRLLQHFGGDDVLKSLDDENSFLNRFATQTLNIEKPKNLVAGLAGKAPVVGTVQVGERQTAVDSVLEAASSSAGVSPELVRGIWGIETRFSSHKTMVSPSGCSGPFQFSRGTFNEVFGSKELRGRILSEQGDRLEPEVRQALQEGKWSVKTEWGSDLRFHPVVSTYAAAEYMKQVGNTIGADPKNHNDFGKIYAGYNVGPGNARKLASLDANGSQANAGRALGSAASWNPAFFTGGASASEALGRYQAYVESSISSYNKSFKAGEPAPARVAEAKTKAPDGSLRVSFETATSAEQPIEKRPVVEHKKTPLSQEFAAKADPAQETPAQTPAEPAIQIIPDLKAAIAKNRPMALA